MGYYLMMPSLFRVIPTLLWTLLFGVHAMHGGASPRAGRDFALTPPPEPELVLVTGETLGLAHGDFTMSRRPAKLALAAMEPGRWPAAKSTPDGRSAASREPVSAQVSIAMWFGVLGATLLILPRLRRR